MVSRFLVAVCCCTAAETAQAQVWRFLPGDAYFQTEITREIVEQLKAPLKDDTIILHYSFGSAPIEGEVHGYKSTEIRSLTDNRRHRIVDIHRRIRSRIPLIAKITETNGHETRIENNAVQMLIYNSGFDGTEHRIGLRYNESWPADEKAIAGKMLRSYPGSVTGIADKYFSIDWEYAKEVNPLIAVIPEAANQRPYYLQNVPVIVDARNVQFVLLPDIQLQALRRGDTGDWLEHGAWYYLIDGEKVTQVTHDNDGWHSNVVESEPKKSN